MKAAPPFCVPADWSVLVTPRADRGVLTQIRQTELLMLPRDVRNRILASRIIKEE